MKLKIVFIFLFLILGIAIGAVFANLYPGSQSFETRRTKILQEMDDIILQQSQSGDYKCCIEPACTMCFMGSWLWDDGICRCDEEIIKGDFDRVCPQCKRALEEGQCKSSEPENCEIS